MSRQRNHMDRKGWATSREELKNLIKHWFKIEESNAKRSTSFHSNASHLLLCFLICWSIVCSCIDPVSSFWKIYFPVGDDPVDLVLFALYQTQNTSHLIILPARLSVRLQLPPVHAKQQDKIKQRDACCVPSIGHMWHDMHPLLHFPVAMQYVCCTCSYRSYHSGLWWPGCVLPSGWWWAGRTWEGTSCSPTRSGSRCPSHTGRTHQKIIMIYFITTSRTPDYI